MSFNFGFISIVSIFLVLYLLVTLGLFLLQESLIFFPTKLSPKYQFEHFKNFEERYFNIDTVTCIHALHFKTQLQKKGIILYFHGNARCLFDWGFVADDYTKLGFDVMMPDYRTYGKSTGKLSEQALHDDARMIYNDLLKKYAAEDIIIFGRSLGSGIASKLASEVEAKMLILETPYLSLHHLAKKKMPILPISLLMAYKMDTSSLIDRIPYPIHIIHGTKDLLIPYQHAVELEKLSGQANCLFTIEGGGHNNLSDYKSYQEKMKSILNVVE